MVASLIEVAYSDMCCWRLRIKNDIYINQSGLCYITIARPGRDLLKYTLKNAFSAFVTALESYKHILSISDDYIIWKWLGENTAIERKQ